jgi:hypothetical protein
LRGRVELTVLDGTAIAAGEKQHLTSAQKLGKVVIEISRILRILKNEKYR